MTKQEMAMKTPVYHTLVPIIRTTPPLTLEGATHFLAQFFSSFCSFLQAWHSKSSFPNKVILYSRSSPTSSSSSYPSFMKVPTLLSTAGEEVRSATLSPSSLSSTPPRCRQPPPPPTSSTPPTQTILVVTCSPILATRWPKSFPNGHNLCFEVLQWFC